jgi:hypothetical protein
VTGSSRQLCPPRTPCTTAAEALPAGELHAANAAGACHRRSSVGLILCTLPLEFGPEGLIDHSLV